MEGFLISTDQLMVPSVPDLGSFLENSAAIIGLGSSLPYTPRSCRRRWMILARPATRLGAKIISSPIISSKPSSPPVLASDSSFIFSHCGSPVRISMDSVLAIAPSTRGCSLPFTQISKGCTLPFSTCPITIEKSPLWCSTRYVQLGLPFGIFGRPGQRRLASAGCGTSLSTMRRSGSLPSRSFGVALTAGASSDSTEPST